MIEGNLKKLIQNKVAQLIERTPHTLDQAEVKLVTLICQEVVSSIAEDIAKSPKETKAEEKLIKIQKTWKELNNLLK
jgi:hypothetical protein